MDMKLVEQAILFAPAYAFQTMLEGWSLLIEPPRDGAAPARQASMADPKRDARKPGIAPMLQRRATASDPARLPERSHIRRAHLG